MMIIPTSFAMSSTVELLYSKKIPQDQLRNYKYKVKDGVEFHVLVRSKSTAKSKFTLSPNVPVWGKSFDYKAISEKKLKNYIYDPDIIVEDIADYQKAFPQARIVKESNAGLILMIKVYGEKIPQDLKGLKAKVKVAWDLEDELDHYELDLKL